LREIANVVLPVFGLIGVGYVVAWPRPLSKATAVVLSQFVFVVAVPFLIFRTIVAADFAGVSPWGLWFSGITGTGAIAVRLDREVINAYALAERAANADELEIRTKCVQAAERNSSLIVFAGTSEELLERRGGSTWPCKPSLLWRFGQASAPAPIRRLLHTVITHIPP
jgi:hypothetical protein